MAIKIEKVIKPDKPVIDGLERHLKSKGFEKVHPAAKKRPNQYSRSKSHTKGDSFEEGPLMYQIEWCYEEESYSPPK